MFDKLFRRKPSSNASPRHPDQGKPPEEISGLVFGDINTIRSAKWELYETCRGPADQEYLVGKLTQLCQATDSDIEKSSSLADDMNVVLWDLLCHQGTLYSATPLGLYMILTSLKEVGGHPNREIAGFINHCRRCGTSGIYLRHSEIYRNLAGDMPLFKIEDVFNEFADA